MEVKLSSVKMTTTENGSLALSNTGNKVLDLFSNITRDASPDQVVNAVESAWDESPLYTMKCMFAKRDIRGEGGQGERSIFITFYRWLFNKNHQVAEMNLKNISEYGYWKDLINISTGFDGDEKILQAVYKTFASQLKQDLIDMKAGKPISLAAKWLPSVNSKKSRKDMMAPRLSRAMGFNTNKPSEFLRKNVITPLRKYIQVVERYMCKKNWDCIVYSKVPGIAMKKYRNVFIRRDSERFNKYLHDVKEGLVKINTQTLSPVDLVSAMKGYKMDKVIEAQWMDIIRKGLEFMDNDYKFMGTSTILPVCDVSGSMYGTPMNASIGLGSYISKINRGFFKDIVLTFSDKPKIINLEGIEELHKIVNEFSKSDNVGYNTDLIKTFKLILNMALKYNIPPHQMPDKLLLISDMEFDVATKHTNQLTNLEKIKQLYKKSGHEIPQIIFWNVRSTNTVPCRCDENGVVYISGYSKNIVSMLMRYECMNPLSLMYRILDSSRYDLIKV